MSVGFGSRLRLWWRARDLRFPRVQGSPSPGHRAWCPQRARGLEPVSSPPRARTRTLRSVEVPPRVEQLFPPGPPSARPAGLRSTRDGSGGWSTRAATSGATRACSRARCARCANRTVSVRVCVRVCVRAFLPSEVCTRVCMRVLSLCHFLYYRPQTKLAKVMFSQVSVCPQVGGQGNVFTPPPRKTHNPRADTPGQTPPVQYVLGYTYPSPADTTGYGQQAGGTYPTGMHPCSPYFSTPCI